MEVSDEVDDGKYQEHEDTRGECKRGEKEALSLAIST